MASDSEEMEIFSLAPFDTVLDLLPPADLARLACCCQSALAAVDAAPWRHHCTALLGETLVAFASSSSAASTSQDFWRGLYAASRRLDEMHWCEQLPRQLTTVTGSPLPAAALLARAAHRAVPVGSRYVVLLGGLTRDVGLYQLDVAVLDAAGSMVRPLLEGQPPPPLAHMCASSVTLQPGSLLHCQVAAAAAAAASSLGRKQQQQQQQQQQDTGQQCNREQLAAAAAAAAAPDACRGHTIILFGGLSSDGTEAGGPQLTVLWLSEDVSWGTWLSVTSSGPAPSPRAYACSQPLAGGSRMLVYAGVANGSLAGTAAADVCTVDGCLLLCVYLLDVNGLAWVRRPTWPLQDPPRVGSHVIHAPNTCPGPRKQSLCCRRVNPSSGSEEFVVLGGCGKDGLADFVPYVLDTSSFVWRKGPVTGYLPPSRDAGAVMQLSDEWLLLLGGVSPSGKPLPDVQRLHLPSLAWRPPPRIAASAAAAEQAASSSLDFTATAGFVVGGMRQGAFGDVIVPRLGVLLPGPPWATGAGAASPAQDCDAACPSPPATKPLLAVSKQFNTGCFKPAAGAHLVHRFGGGSQFKPGLELPVLVPQRAPVGWSSEIEIEPGPAQGRMLGAAAGAAAAMRLASGAGAGTAPGPEDWQVTGDPAGCRTGFGLLQLLVALGVLLLLPSIWMMTAE